ncbi:Uncharacterised protein [Klebsiella grimontii]|uniref:Uncharacterized protein n=1 Tax=Klebsiella grimontii TaxID=2058152 RepID=A0A7H4P4S8_9ENTR|nr:Uncharacterised protein [Klebsiella grimontii]
MRVNNPLRLFNNNPLGFFSSISTNYMIIFFHLPCWVFGCHLPIFPCVDIDFSNINIWFEFSTPSISCCINNILPGYTFRGIMLVLMIN